MNKTYIWIPRLTSNKTWKPFKTIAPPSDKNWETKYLKYNDRFYNEIDCERFCDNLNITNEGVHPFDDLIKEIEFCNEIDCEKNEFG